MKASTDPRDALLAKRAKSIRALKQEICRQRDLTLTFENALLFKNGTIRRYLDSAGRELSPEWRAQLFEASKR